ncbi:MAG: hypothetical protein KA310_03295 [Pseudomonadales bacterium]|nr:hypothetical protein [Pseudomonadales bacterium]
MAILGFLIDKLAGATLAGVTLTSFPHSLPGTSPEEVRIQLRSANTATAPGAIVAVGGNASLLTIGLQAASVSLGSNLVFFDAVSQVFWSGIR